ncbi:MAG: methyltransferase domain-containing protein [Dehalococcoidia bacterium]
MGRGMARQNRESNDWTVSLLDVLPTDRILEVGFGPGAAVKSVAELTPEGFVAGIDFSETMVQQAGRLNAAGVAARDGWN